MHGKGSCASNKTNKKKETKMKKLMIMAAVCAMASVSQAYAVKWSATNVRIPAADNPKVSQTGITTSSSNPKFQIGDIALSLFWIDSSGTEQQIFDKVALTAEGKAAYDAIEYNDTIYKAIMADQDGDAVKFALRATYTTADGTYEFYMASNPTDLTPLDVGNVNLGMSMNNGSWNYTANAVPEPTSGLLLLLGVAGLALRRKQK